MLALMLLLAPAAAPAPHFTAKHSFLVRPNGKAVRFTDLAGRRGTVVVFLSLPCPVSTSYHEALGRLAQGTGGRLFELENEQALPGVLDEIVADLREQYVLGFAPDPAGSPGRLRKLSVKVPGRGRVVVRHRVGYRLQH